MIEAEILTGAASGQIVFVPRIPLIHNVKNEIPFKRTQFPLRVSFALSVNKSQGQTYKRIGLHLERPCFAHGQFYVGVSRVGCSDGLFISAAKSKQGEPNVTRNLVTKTVLQQ